MTFIYAVNFHTSRANNEKMQGLAHAVTHWITGWDRL